MRFLGFFRMVLIGLVLAMVGAAALPAFAQETSYSDPTGLFTVIIPAGWTDDSTAEYGLFTKGGITVYLLTVPESDVQAGIDAALSRFDPDSLKGTMMPMGEVPAPNGTWTQTLYTVSSGEVTIVSAQSVGDVTVVLMAVAESMGAVQTSNNDIIAINASVSIQGVTGTSGDAGAAPPADAAPAVPPAEGVVDFPELTGEYAVGRTTYTWVDPDREEAYTSEEGDNRVVTVWVWYPAAPGADAVRAPYLSDGMDALFQAFYGTGSGNVQTQEYEAAPIQQTNSGYPVLIFSPGNAQNALTYTVLLEEIASHGYVVVGLDHAYNSRMTTLADSQVVEGKMETLPENDEHLNTRIADIEFAITQMQQVNSSDDLLKGSMDFDHLAIWGHSYGGTTAAEACHRDERCLAAIVIDWQLMGEVAEVGLPQPIMLMDSERIPAEQMYAEIEEVTGQDFPDDAVANQAAIINSVFAQRTSTTDMLLAMSPVAYHVVIEGTRHMSFSDVPQLTEVQPLFANFESGEASIDPLRGKQVISSYILAFFDQYLKGEASPLLDGASTDYPEVTFTRGEG